MDVFTNVRGSHCISVLSLPEYNPETTATHGWSPMGFVRLCIWSITGCLAGEGGDVLDDAQLHGRAVRSLFDALTTGTDHGFLPSDMSAVWGGFDRDQQQEIMRRTMDTMEGLYDFPSFGDMSVIATDIPVTLTLGDYRWRYVLPVSIDTNKGPAIVVPLAGLPGDADMVAVVAYSLRSSAAFSGAVVHGWDASRGNIVCLSDDDVDRRVARIVNMLTSQYT